MTNTSKDFVGFLLKLAGRFSVAAGVLLFSPVLIRANSISISDLLEGSPTVTTDLTGAKVVTSPELAVITGTFQGTLTSGTRAVLLTEPGSSGTQISDFVTLSVVAGVRGLPSLVVVTFESDGAAGFDAAVQGLEALHTPTLAETGA